ncbi:MAG: PAS domain S-box protein, partial [Deltaproteobacteria bacterium]|nr:PAS domain S-box protein [Deltaproteobacteria bacterium]
HVLLLIRLSSFGWIPLGPLALDLFVEVTGSVRSRYRRIVPFAYATAALGIGLYIFTPLFVHSPIRVAWGWSYEFGPLFALAFLPTIFYVCGSLMMWPGLIKNDISPGEKRQVLWMFFGILVPTMIASVTDVLLPSRGIHVPRLGSTSILVIGAIVAWSIRRHGRFLLVPSAFTREILETLQDGVAMLRDGGRIRSCNDALAQLIGMSQAELHDRPISEFLPHFDLDPTAEIIDCETELFPITGTGGRNIPVSVSLSPLRDDKDEVIGCVIAVRDLREVETLRSRLITSDRLAAVGELAAGIAHEINNPITFVRANLVALREDWSDLNDAADDFDRSVDLDMRFREGEEILEESIEGVDRITTIVRDVGAISHAGIGRFDSVDINELLDNAVNVATLSFSVAMERCYSDLPPIRCAPQQLKQVFLNLLINAFQAIGDFGNIHLVTATAGDGIVIRIQDDGCGIAEADIERIFDPFFTTRPVGEGTGLGLALCYQIIRNHSGSIEVESEPGVGTTVSIQLPFDPEEAGTAT